MTLASSPPLDVSKCPGTKCIFFVSVSAGIRRKLRSLSLKGCMPSAYAPDVLTRAMRQSFRSRRRGVYGMQLRDSSSIAPQSTPESSSTHQRGQNSLVDLQLDGRRYNGFSLVYR